MIHFLLRMGRQCLAVTSITGTACLSVYDHNRNRRVGQILILEDDESIRLALRKALTQAGHSVLEAANGRKGHVSTMSSRLI